MSGKIKAGKGGLIGNAGGFYVMAELLKNGVIAGLTPRNARAFDILATKDNKTVKIRVKTKSQEFLNWQWMAKKDKSIFRDLSDIDDFTILVDLAYDLAKISFYIIKSIKLDGWLKKDYEDWVVAPEKKGQPHNPETRKRNLNSIKYKDKIESYKNNWDVLWG